MSKKYWLLKSEGGCYSIDDFKKDSETPWTGIRNYQARNFMMNDMKVGDLILFYHSNGDVKNPTGIYGLGSVSKPPHPDETQFDKNDEHFDPKSKKDKPLWYCTDITFLKKFNNPIPLSYIKLDSKLAGMMVRKVGSRLSVQPVSTDHGEYLVKLSRSK